MQEAIQEKVVDKIAERLLEFIDDFYQQQLEDYNDKIKNIISKTINS
jgi:predicted house-cleaning noncanonical NTP pyrophosphatase (MazG superfamily)